MRKVLIVGNCQAQLLEAMLLSSGADVAVERLPPVFQMKAADRASVDALMSSADTIFAQRVSGQYELEWLRPRFLKEVHKNKVCIWPNIYFDGYFPGVRYIYLDRLGKLVGPLEDYHVESVVNGWRLGRTAGAVAEALLSNDSDEDFDSFSASLSELRLRERDVDVPISDFLYEMADTAKMFYTPNHPYNSVLAEMLRRLCEWASLPLDVSSLVGFRYSLNRIYVPVFPSVRHRRGIQFDRACIFRGVEVSSRLGTTPTLGPGKSYSALELVDEFFKVYDVFPPTGGPSREDTAHANRAPS